MTQPTPEQLAQRLAFSARLLAAASEAIAANAAHLPDSPPRRDLQKSARCLAKISGVHQRLSLHFMKQPQKGSKRQPTAATGSPLEATSHD